MPKSNHHPRKTPRTPLVKRLLPWLLLVLILFAVGLVIGTLRTTEKPDRVSPTAPASLQSFRTINLYFASLDGRSLGAEARQINDCQDEVDCLRDTVQALIDGPQQGLTPILPSQTRLLNITVEDALVQVDFSRELIAAHPGGTQSELLTVYGLADTLAANFPHLRQVRILVEGVPADTLKGHIDLRQPIYPDFSFVEEGDAPLGKLKSLPVGGDE